MSTQIYTQPLSCTASTLTNYECVMVLLYCQGIARTQSPTTKNCTPEFPTFGGIADFSQARCNALASTWAACLRDHKQPASGKLIQVCQLDSYEEAAVFNTCGSLTTPTLYLWCVVNTPFTAVAPKWLKKLQSITMVVQSSQLCISGDVELNPVQLGSVQSSTLLENTVNCTLWCTFGSHQVGRFDMLGSATRRWQHWQGAPMIRTADCHVCTVWHNRLISNLHVHHDTFL